MVKKIKATLFISEDKREKIRRSGLSLEEYFNRIYETHERFDMDRWTAGCFWMKYDRVCLLRSETLNRILDHFDDETLIKLGREVGEKLQKSLKYSFKLEAIDDEAQEKILEHLNAVTGWGNFILENRSIFILTPVFTNPFFIQGYIEGILNLELKLVESHPDRVTFNIIARGQNSS